MKKIVVAVVIGALLPFIALGVVIATGALDMSATRPTGFVERFVGGMLAERSVARRATRARNPLFPTPGVLHAGLVHYRDDCVMCHGAPRVPPGDAGKGLNPAAPDLASADAQEASDGELYQVIAQGIRMTGMPGWAPTRSEKEIWELVVFVRHLPSLSPEERRELQGGAAERQPSSAGAAAGQLR